MIRNMLRGAMALAALSLASVPVLAQNAATLGIKNGAGATVNVDGFTDASGNFIYSFAPVDKTGALFGSATNPFSVTSTPVASESHLGEVGGNQTTIAQAGVTTASSSYSSGNAVGGLVTMAGAARVAGGTGLIQSLTANFATLQNAPMEFWVFNDAPTASTCTDKAAFVLAAADAPKVVWVFSMTRFYGGGTGSIGLADDRAIPFATKAGATSLYVCPVTRATPTFGSTTDLTTIVRTVRN